jgi:pantoate--beta-alanine ligase
METHVTSLRNPRLVASIDELRAAWDAYRASHSSIGLVPTMGALHEGHLSLVRRSRAECAGTVATIFVNPTQFGPREDLTRYPRDLEADLQLLAREGVDLVFAPSAEEMYPRGFSTYVEPPEVARLWEGACRPGHFRGVATVVMKLFHLIPADVAFFGQKDYQQLRVIQQMVRDLSLALEIRMCPTVREPDGLAMSSRNRYLSTADRERAVAISRALDAGRRMIEKGERRGEAIREQMRKVLADAGIDHVEYATIADSHSLAEVDAIAGPVVLLIAAFVGETRLIDNCVFG